MAVSVESEAEAWIKSLGKLSPRRKLQAAQVIRLARAVDESVAGSAVAAASLELRQAMKDLRAGRESVVPAGPVSQRDRLAEQRLKRQRKANGQSA